MGGSYSFLVGPLTALAALCVILLISRWVFSPPTPRPRPAAPQRADYGLLVPVARARTHQDADLLRDVLREAGIRCTVSADGDGAVLLVFRDDADRAAALVR